MAEFQYTEESMAADNPPNKPSDAVTEALGMVTSTPPSTGQDITASLRQTMGTGEAALRAMPAIESERAEQAEKFGAKRIAELERLGKYGVDIAESAKKEASAIYGKPEYQMLKMPEFTPSQASVGELITMFTMVNTMAMLAGGGSRNSGMAALASLNGALDGYKKGRQDIYKMEMINFDKNLKSLQQNNEARKIELEKALKEVALNKDVGLAKLKEIELQMKGSQIEQDLRLGRFDSALKKLDMLVKAGENARNKYADYQIRQQQMATQREVAMIRAAGAGGKAKNAPPAKDVSQIVAKKALLNEYDKLIKEYTENPAAFSKGVRTLTALPLVGKGYGDFMEKIARVDPKKNPEAHRAAMFLAKLERAVTPERHSFYGAALTATELPRYERTVPTITDDPSVVLTFLKNNRQSISDALRSQITTLQDLGKDIDFNVVTKEAVNNPMNFDNNSQWMPKAKQP